MCTFACLMKTYMRRIRAGAKDVADELGVSRQTILNWVNGTSKPTKCDKILKCAHFFRLDQEETDTFLQSVGCSRIADNVAITFARQLFKQFPKLPSPFILLLNQTHVNLFPFHEVLLKQAEELYSPAQVLRITPPFLSTDPDRYFMELSEQCGFGHVCDGLGFEKMLRQCLKDTTIPLFLLINHLEQSAACLRQQLTHILYSLCEAYKGRLHILLCGGEQLIELKYKGDDLPLLREAAVKRWPELSRSEVYTLRDYHFKGLLLDDALVDQFLSISGGQPQLLNECLKLRQKYPDLPLENYVKILSENDYVWQLFTPFGKDMSAKKRIYKWLQQEDLGKAQPYILDDLLRQLYWKELLVERGKRLYWRCEAVRMAGRTVLRN